MRIGGLGMLSSLSSGTPKYHIRQEIIQLQETLFLRVYSVETTLKPWENPFWFSIRFLAYPGEFDEMQFHLMQNKWFILILHNS